MSADIQKCLETFLPDHDVGVLRVALSEDRGCRTLKSLAAESDSAQVGQRQSWTPGRSYAFIREDDAQDLGRQRGEASFAGRIILRNSVSEIGVSPAVRRDLQN